MSSSTGSKGSAVCCLSSSFIVRLAAGCVAGSGRIATAITNLSLSPRLSSRTGTEEVQERQVYIDYLRIVFVVFYF